MRRAETGTLHQLHQEQQSNAAQQVRPQEEERSQPQPDLMAATIAKMLSGQQKFDAAADERPWEDLLPNIPDNLMPALEDNLDKCLIALKELRDEVQARNDRSTTDGEANASRSAPQEENRSSGAAPVPSALLQRFSQQVEGVPLPSETTETQPLTTSTPQDSLLLGQANVENQNCNPLLIMRQHMNVESLMQSNGVGAGGASTHRDPSSPTKFNDAALSSRTPIAMSAFLQGPLLAPTGREKDRAASPNGMPIPARIDSSMGTQTKIAVPSTFTKLSSSPPPVTQDAAALNNLVEAINGLATGRTYSASCSTLPVARMFSATASSGQQGLHGRACSYEALPSARQTSMQSLPNTARQKSVEESVLLNRAQQTFPQAQVLTTQRSSSCTALPSARQASGPYPPMAARQASAEELILPTHAHPPVPQAQVLTAQASQASLPGTSGPRTDGSSTHRMLSIGAHGSSVHRLLSVGPTGYPPSPGPPPQLPPKAPMPCADGSSTHRMRSVGAIGSSAHRMVSVGAPGYPRTPASSMGPSPKPSPPVIPRHLVPCTGGSSTRSMPNVGVPGSPLSPGPPHQAPPKWIPCADGSSTHRFLTFGNQGYSMTLAPPARASSIQAHSPGPSPQTLPRQLLQRNDGSSTHRRMTLSPPPQASPRVSFKHYQPCAEVPFKPRQVPVASKSKSLTLPPGASQRPSPQQCQSHLRPSVDEPSMLRVGPHGAQGSLALPVGGVAALASAREMRSDNDMPLPASLASMGPPPSLSLLDREVPTPGRVAGCGRRFLPTVVSGEILQDETKSTQHKTW